MLQGATQLSEHLAAHPEISDDHLGGPLQATTVRNQRGQATSSTHHVGSERQEPKGENIEQVLRDLEELVDRDLSAKHQDEKATLHQGSSSSLPEADQMAEWPTNSIVAFPSIQLPSISDPSSSSSSAWLTQPTPPSLGPLSPPRSSLRSAPYKRGGPGVQMGTRGGGNTEVACGQCGWMFDNANFLQLHRVLMHSRRRETKVLVITTTSFG